MEMSSNKYNSNAAPSYKWTFRAIIQYEDMRYVVPKANAQINEHRRTRVQQ